MARVNPSASNPRIASRRCGEAGDRPDVRRSPERLALLDEERHWPASLSRSAARLKGSRSSSRNAAGPATLSAFRRSPERLALLDEERHWPRESFAFRRSPERLALLDEERHWRRESFGRSAARLKG